MNEELLRLIREALNVGGLHMTQIGGGSINQTFKLQSGNRTWFCKINSSTAFPELFQKEANGLHAIGQHKAIRVPTVLHCFEHEDQQVLILEWITDGPRTKTFWQSFGESLAAMHRISHERFGYDEDNYMGSIPQQNRWQPDWNSFFIQQRLMPMVERCANKGLLTIKQQAGFEKLYTQLPQIFTPESPSLLHGDLWAGNFMCNKAQQPVLIDPAVYFGHRSVDLAMTTLFGGFDQSFYEAYAHHFPLPANHEEQWAVANLYPLLIHLYLFGSSYLLQIERTLMRFA